MAFGAGVFIGEVTHDAELESSRDAAWNLGPDHVDAFLALRVNTSAEAVGAELIGGEFAFGELLRSVSEGLDVGANGGVVSGFYSVPVGLHGIPYQE